MHKIRHENNCSPPFYGTPTWGVLDRLVMRRIACWCWIKDSALLICVFNWYYTFIFCVRFYDISSHICGGHKYARQNGYLSVVNQVTSLSCGASFRVCTNWFIFLEKIVHAHTATTQICSSPSVPELYFCSLWHCDLKIINDCFSGEHVTMQTTTAFIRF